MASLYLFRREPEVIRLMPTGNNQNVKICNRKPVENRKRKIVVSDQTHRIERTEDAAISSRFTLTCGHHETFNIVTRSARLTSLFGA